ncbi:hypothetical protein P8R33_07940 [Qipengyuania sp. XHP0211]|uniref:hypothetical protein n=1 Tax=Qipengyuania sp. XHP0211 TaxID=3038079 RepID=UPI00241C71E3|nr:hypothetical protein [Qipengyuania sp. XHP0211]MDG5751031.1 hypothetical protein [Qipengyuania sp. XHP0211]
MKRALLIALPLALVGCGGSEASDDLGADVISVDERIADAKIVVSADGVGARGSEPLRFGATREEVDVMAAQAFGSQGEESSNEECGAGPMDFSQYGPLQLAFLDGKFAGWFLREGDAVATSDGVRPGVSTLDALKGERQVQELDTTLEGEFQYTTADYGTITGFADEAGNIDALQAGVSCFFR